MTPGEDWAHNPIEDEIARHRASMAEERRRLYPLTAEGALDLGRGWTTAPVPPEGCVADHSGEREQCRPPTFEEEAAIKATLKAEEEGWITAFRRAWGEPWQLWITFLVFLVAFDIALARSLRGTYGYRSVSALWLWWPLLISTIAGGWVAVAVYGIARQWGWRGIVRCAAGAALCCVVGVVAVHFGWMRW